jgi:PAS domain S-box-containing protein
MPWDSITRDDMMYFATHSAAATWVVDANGYAVGLPEWSRLTGQTPAQLRGDGWMDALHPDDLERVRAAWQTAVDHGTPYNTDYRVRCADGIYRWFNARGVLLLDEGGGPRMWIGLILPIAGGSQIRNPAARRVLREAASITPAALRAARAALNISAEELAEIASVSRSTIQRFEQGVGGATPRASSLTQLIDALSRRGIRFVVENDVAIGIVMPSANDPLAD